MTDTAFALDVLSATDTASVPDVVLAAQAAFAPDAVSAAQAAFASDAALLSDNIFAAKSVAAALVLGVLWLLEGLVPMFEGRRERARHGAANVALGVGNAAVAALVFAGATLVATEWARANSFGLLHWLGVAGVWAYAGGFVLLDLWQYLWHRLNHRVPFLWRFHAVHHADREMDATSGLRFHTGEIVLSSVARLAVLPLLGMTVAQVLVYEAVLLPVVFFHHSNLRLSADADRSLRWLVVTPWMHWVHHSNHQPETDSNYSSVFSFWDRLFGSFRLVGDPRRLTLGLDHTDRREWATLPGMLTMPFRGGGHRRAGGRQRRAGAPRRPHRRSGTAGQPQPPRTTGKATGKAEDE